MAKVITVKQMGEFMALYDEKLKQILLDPNNIGQNDEKMFVSKVDKEKITTNSQGIEQLKASVNNKVDKIPGKGLSTNDYIKATVDTQINDAKTNAISEATKKVEALKNEVNPKFETKIDKTFVLDDSNKIKSELLPSFVDDVLEFETKTNFPQTGEGGKIYLAIDTNKSYRWGGSSYVELSSSVALGETSGTAYAGDKGKALSDKVTKIDTELKNGTYKVKKAEGADTATKVGHGITVAGKKFDGSAEVTVDLTADNISETATKVFVTPEEKADIAKTKNDLAEHIKNMSQGATLLLDENTLEYISDGDSGQKLSVKHIPIDKVVNLQQELDKKLSATTIASSTQLGMVKIADASGITVGVDGTLGLEVATREEIEALFNAQ